MYNHQLIHQLEIKTTRVRVAQLPKTHNSKKTIQHNPKHNLNLLYEMRRIVRRELRKKESHFFLLAVTLN